MCVRSSIRARPSVCDKRPVLLAELLNETAADDQAAAFAGDVSASRAASPSKNGSLTVLDCGF
ncbi:hypothetical protein SS05631_a42000 (plasmid) [Sinorhizobium sp. CCBAU 05631]|nr:hypothetical protein SS05631_a42000 [Sinorhizobium sp. CCBAU 05631]